VKAYDVGLEFARKDPALPDAISLALSQ